MTGEPIRVLHYIKHLGAGGGETLLYNIYKNIDREKIQFDFLVNQEKEEILDKKIIQLGGRKIALIKKEPIITPFKVVICSKALYTFLKNEKYKIIHIHCSNGQGLLFACIAKRAGVPIRIVHIHNSDVDGRFKFLKRFFHIACKILFMNEPTDRVACSSKAARWLYSKDICEKNRYILLKNGIEIDKYMFNAVERAEMRNEWRWSDKKIIINIGRMEKQKNQLFLIDVFALICKKSDDYRMVIIGNGSLKNQITSHIKALQIEDRVKMIDHVDSVEKYLWASDLFVLPSLEEGLGIASIEAQASGLMTIVSDKVPKEAFMSDIIRSYPLDNDHKYWARSILKKDLERDRIGTADINNVRNAGYDIEETAYRLQKLYLQRMGDNSGKGVSRC